jgi:hypothetical protein
MTEAKPDVSPWDGTSTFLPVMLSPVVSEAHPTDPWIAPLSVGISVVAIEWWSSFIDENWVWAGPLGLLEVAPPATAAGISSDCDANWWLYEGLLRVEAAFEFIPEGI